MKNNTAKTLLLLVIFGGGTTVSFIPSTFADNHRAATTLSIDKDRLPGWTDNASNLSAEQRPSCKNVYPLPDGYENWSNCERIGNSQCGGPPQCACIPEQQLVTFKCDQGTYNQCYSYADDGCPKPTEKPDKH